MKAEKSFGCLPRITRDDGNILIMSVIIVGILLATGLGYMKWAVDERWDSAYEEATVQAYFLAQTGVIEGGLSYLRSRKPSDLPTGTIFRPPAAVPGVGEYLNTTISRVSGLGDANVFQRSDTYDVLSTGRTTFINHQKNAHERVFVERTSKMRARLRSFANYMYLTHYETTLFGEIIWFWTPDHLYGRVHSNDFIGIKYSPSFYGPISSSKDHFLELDAEGAYFEYEPQFNVPPVNFPKTAETIRANASPWVSTRDGRDMIRVEFGGEDGIRLYRRPLGTGGGDTLFMSLPPINEGAMFIDGQCEISGLMDGNGNFPGTVVGVMTIGSADDMWLIGDIRYDGSDRYTGHFGDNLEQMSQMHHMLGLVSEGNIIIRNNTVNGRENGAQYHESQINRHSIIITAGLVALGESFTFQHMNDEFDLYQGPTPDERGTIHLRGAVTQLRRGYVHRSNHDGTGYAKDYLYDFRFDERPPPYYLEATDSLGFGLFDIISWGELRPTR